jgi:hypothetical protein
MFSHRTLSYGRRSERLALREEIIRIVWPRGAKTVIRIRPLGSLPKANEPRFVDCIRISHGKGKRIFKRQRRVGERDTMLLEIPSRFGPIPLVLRYHASVYVCAPTSSPLRCGRRCQLKMRLSDARMRRRQTKLIHLHDRLPPWLTENTPHYRSNRLLGGIDISHRNKQHKARNEPVWELIALTTDYGRQLRCRYCSIRAFFSAKAFIGAARGGKS